MGSKDSMAPETHGASRAPEYSVVNLDRGSTVATRVHVASTSAARRHGLLGISELADGSGLWIAPCEAIHTFGMRMPLDVLFLDSRSRVRKASSNVAPGRIRVCFSASSVLELPSGTIARSQTVHGDRLAFRPARLQSGAEFGSR